MSANPFVGPFPVPAGTQLFGRNEEAATLYDTLLGNRVVLMHAPSGAGKTSLLQAKVLPMLARKLRVLPLVRLAAPKKWSGTGNPFVASAVAALDVEGKAANEPTSIAALLDRYAPEEEGKPHLVVFDQFEEVLTAEGDEQVRLKFFRDLAEALSIRNRWAIFSMRDEFVGALDPYLRLLPTQLRIRFRLGFLAFGNARTVVEQTAALGKRSFDAESLIRLIDELRTVQTADGGERLGSFVEPVHLQIVCRTLWDTIEGDVIVLDKEHDTATDVNAALASYYKLHVRQAATATGAKTDAELDNQERVVREWFDDVLITPRGFRGLTMQGPTVSHADNVLKILADAYLVRVEPRAAQGTWIELAHDRLVEPVRQNNVDWFALKLTYLQRQADLWDSRGRPPSLLLDARELEAEKNTKPSKGVESDFLEASRQAVRGLRQKARLWNAVTALVLVIFAGAAVGVFMFQQQNEELQKTNQELRDQRTLLVTQKKQLAGRKKQLSDFKAALDEGIRFGYSAEQIRAIVAGGLRILNAPNNPTLQTSVPAQADRALQALLAKNAGQLQAVTVQYYADPESVNYDLARITTDLKSVGFHLVQLPGKAELKTNSIFFGKEMLDRQDAVKIVALTLMRANVEIRGMAVKKRGGLMIQVGGWKAAESRPPYTVADIVNKRLDELVPAP